MNRLMQAGLAALSTLVLTAGTASAATVYPKLERGMRGLDVSTLQQLLNQRGYWTGADGTFGRNTEQVVKQFQISTGLSPDGVAGNATWTLLSPTLRRGSTGPAVEALQNHLNETHGETLVADGVFGRQTEAAVKRFQSHMGLDADGVVGRETWGAIAGHFVELPLSGPGFYRYHPDRPNSTWGTGHTIATLKVVAQQWANLGYTARIGVGDISRQHGGPMDGHASHQVGRDFDIHAMRNDGQEGEVLWTQDAYSRKLTQQLVDLLYATGEVEQIFFNDDSVRGVTYWPNHDDHLHVRLKAH